MSAVLTGNDFATQSGHWYDGKTGAPAYTIVGANGKERAVTLRDARKLGLVPSVTTILRQEASPGLERWKIQQALMSAMTLPRTPGEEDGAFMARALKDSQEQARKASERGSYLHGLLEQSIQKAPIRASEADLAIINPVLDWLKVNFEGYQWSPERSFANPGGFGGKLDLFGERGVDGEQCAVLDFKTKSGIKDKSPDDLAYPEHQTQLAAYAYGLARCRARCINLFIDTDVPGLIVVKEWTQDEINSGWLAFSSLLQLWKVRKNLT